MNVRLGVRGQDRLISTMKALTASHPPHSTVTDFAKFRG